MKIERDNDKVYSLPLGELDNGEIFEFYDDVWSGVYIKSKQCKLCSMAGDDDDEYCYATRLSDGQIIGFMNDDVVYPLEAKLVIQ